VSGDHPYAVVAAIVLVTGGSYSLGFVATSFGRTGSLLTVLAPAGRKLDGSALSQAVKVASNRLRGRGGRVA
jgi:hypothetical protein